MGNSRYLLLFSVILILFPGKGPTQNFYEDDDGGEDDFDGWSGSGSGSGSGDHHLWNIAEVVTETTEALPAITSGPVYPTAIVGGSVILPCDVTNLGDYVVTWKKLEEKLIFINGTRTLKDERFQLVNETSLSITDIEPTDGGKYTCDINTVPERGVIHTLTVGSIPTKAVRVCPNKPGNWIDLGGEFCYIIVEYGNFKWMDAVYQCYKEGGYLASFHSSEEVKRIIRYSKGARGRLHIGLWKHQDGTLEWVDRSAFDYRNWDSEEPNDRSERCVEIYTESGKWNDIPCSHGLGYICSTPKTGPVPRPRKVCPNGSSKWNDFGGELCYIIEGEAQATWHEALHNCSQEGGSLATFHSIEDVSVLIPEIRKYDDRMHIGLRQNADGVFEWEDRSMVDFDFWAIGEPNDPDERCGEIYPRSGVWNDIPCDKREGYICSALKVDAEISAAVATVLPTDVSSVEICGGDIISDEGIIQSPHYPQNYGPNEYCFWKITVPDSYRIAFNFRAIEMEYGADCEYDYVEVRDGHYEESTVLVKLCGSDIAQAILTSGNKASVKFVSDKVHENTGFLADFSKGEKCGGNIVADEGVIESKNYPQNYESNENCVWQITVPESYIVQLRFLAFEMEEGGSCKNDYLEVVDGHDTTSPILARFCGDHLPKNVISSGHKITVKFESDNFKEYYGFLIEFNKTEAVNIFTTIESPTEPEAASCGGNIESERGVLMSPNYPKDYDSGDRCIWRISIPDNNQIVLRFKTFSLEGGSCNYDYVQVLDGHDDDSPVLGRFCGGGIPEELTSSINKMSVKFTSDSSSEYSGFAAVFHKGNEYNATKAGEHPLENLCGEDIISEEGVLQSPNYPENYGPNQRCTWRITVPTDYKILLQFQSFKVEIHVECSYDYLEIRDGHFPDSPLLAKLCGYNIPKSITSSTNKLTVFFRSDSTSEYNGFSAEFKKGFPVLPGNVTTRAPSICGGEIYSESNGTIRSPNYPQNYEPLLECTWKITVPEDQQIVLHFESLDMELGEDCKFDSLTVFDGHDPSSNPVLATFCGGSDPEIIRSSSNKLTVKFVTDDTVETSGFSANYYAKADTCKEEIFADAGVIQSPNFPDYYEGQFEKCVWSITVPETYVVVLHFTEFELPISTYCKEDFVEILDGNETSNAERKFCGVTIPNRFRSSGNKVTLVLQTGATSGPRAFRAEFKKDICGEDIVAESGVISSPNYPEHYAPNEDCTWKITVPENNRIVLRFQAFDLEGGSCTYDFVEIREGHNQNGYIRRPLCGDSIPPILRSSSNKMSIRFRSDSSDQRSGFNATFARDICGGDIASNSGIITSPDYPDKYPSLSNCTWKITVSENHDVVLQFQRFELDDSDATCRLDYVEIRDGHEPDSFLLGKFCGNSVPREIRSSTNKMAVTFVSDPDMQEQGFRAEFRAEVSRISELESLLRQFPSVVLQQRMKNQKVKTRP